MSTSIFFLSLFLLICVENNPVSFAAETTGVMERANPLTDFFSREETIKFAGYGEDKISTVLVTGTLLCHPRLLSPPHRLPLPVSGATVAVSCHSGRKTRQSSRLKSKTDEDGEFLFDLPSHLHGIPNLEKVCRVRVVQLPNDSPCKPAFRGKCKGIRLSSIDEGIRTYTAGTIKMSPTTAEISRHVRGRKTEMVK